MKKLITSIAILLTLNASALGFTISYNSFSSGVKPNSAQAVELNMVDSRKIGNEIVNIIIVHVNPDNTVSDSLVLFSFPISDWTKYPYGNLDRRFWFNMPADYPNGKFRITISYTAGNIMGFYIANVTGIEDKIIDTKETPQYYDLNGKLLEEPKGLCIEVINGVRRKIYYFE